MCMTCVSEHSFDTGNKSTSSTKRQPRELKCAEGSQVMFNLTLDRPNSSRPDGLTQGHPRSRQARGPSSDLRD